MYLLHQTSRNAQITILNPLITVEKSHQLHKKAMCIKHGLNLISLIWLLKRVYQ